jgi:hypothetical protein
MLGDEYLKNESKDESIKNILLTHIKEHKTYLKKDD